MAPFKEAEGCRYTFNAKTNRLYVHIKAWPFQYLHLPELAGKIRYAQFLGDGSEVKFTEDAWTCGKKATPDNSVTLRLPVIQPDIFRNHVSDPSDRTAVGNHPIKELLNSDRSL